MRTVRIEAVAKVNLGLSVLGRRADGYHDLDTVMAMIDLADTITISPGTTAGITIRGMDDVAPTENLMYRAAAAWCERTGIAASFHIEIEKRIPSPGGLGGGSSDAAATLRALNALYGDPLSIDTLTELAGMIGSDCPFFLGTAAARATGTGTTLLPVPPPDGWLVLATPPLQLLEKTASLYRDLRPEDYSDTSQIDSIVQSLTSGDVVETNALRNSFEGPVQRLMPSVRWVRTTLESAGVPMALTGAGPTLFAITETNVAAQLLATRVRNLVSADVQVHVATFLPTSTQPRLTP